MIEQPAAPPHSPEAEQCLLGGVLLDNRAFDRASEIVRESDFYSHQHRLIWRAMAGLIEAGKPADIVTVQDALERTSKPGETGGSAYLAALAQNTPSAANIRRYAELVRERARFRAVQSAAQELQDLAMNPGARSADEIVATAEARLLAVLDRGGRDYVSLKDSMAGALEQIDVAYHRDGGISGLSCGFEDLDHMTGGFEAGDLVIIAGRTSMGKTALAMNIAEHVATSTGPVAVFSLEMAQKQLAMRVLAGGAGVAMSALRAGRLSDEDWQRLTGAVGRLHEVPIFIDDTPAVTCTHVRARARRIAREQGGLSLIVVDYLQMLRAPESRSREQEVAAVSRGLKAIAKELNVPVLCLAQLNRDPESRPDKRPTLGDLRESGAIEQDADLVAFIYRDEVYHEDSWAKGCAEILIRKQRNGPLGTVWLTYRGELMRFEHCAERPQRPEKVAPIRAPRGFDYKSAAAGD